MRSVYLVAVFCLVALNLACVDAKSIMATAILFRHGERTPVDGNPGLQCALSQDIGVGQLTRVRFGLLSFFGI